MMFFNRLMLAIALAFGLSGAAQAATAPAVKVFEGIVLFDLLPVGGGRVDALADGLVSGPGADPFAFNAGGEFALSPLGDGVTNFFLNILASGFDLVLGSVEIVGLPLVMAGPTADVPFAVSGGTWQSLYGPEGLLRLSGLAGPDGSGQGTVEVAVFLAPVPLPAPALLLIGAVAGLGALRLRRAV